MRFNSEAIDSSLVSLILSPSPQKRPISARSFVSGHSFPSGVFDITNLSAVAIQLSCLPDGLIGLWIFYFGATKTKSLVKAFLFALNI